MTDKRQHDADFRAATLVRRWSAAQNVEEEVI
jgi:hypothetical protein